MRVEENAFHERVKCPVCKDMFTRRTKPRGGKRSKNIRWVGCITCSPKCSIVWNRDFWKRQKGPHKKYNKNL